MLQGSLDNFALDEVLGLLSSTGKTGRLNITGDRGEGSLTIRDGLLSDATASYTSNGTEPEDVVFELLRYVEGEFAFEVMDVMGSGDERDVIEVLRAADDRLADWRTIEAVVPSLDHVVNPVRDLPSEDVVIDRGEWKTLRIIAAGCPASTVCDHLGLGEVEGSRKIMGLADRGLVTVGVDGEMPSDHDPFDLLSGYDNESAANSMPMGSGHSDDYDMPAAPTVDDLMSLAISDDGPMPPPPDAELVGSMSSAGNGSGESDDAPEGESKPGGLLMRYLRSDD